MDRWLHVIGIFFYLIKVYDVTDHTILLDKLNYYGMRGLTNLWFKSYSFHHAQFVEINYLEKNIIQNTDISPFREINVG
jgi:hypothetical protein